MRRVVPARGRRFDVDIVTRPSSRLELGDRVSRRFSRARRKDHPDVSYATFTGDNPHQQCGRRNRNEAVRHSGQTHYKDDGCQRPESFLGE